MVMMESIIMNNCRLCQDKPGQHNINADKKLIKEIYDCVKIRVNKSMNLLPHSICEECKNTIKNFFIYKQQIQNVDKSLRKLLLNVNLKNDGKNSTAEVTFKCSNCPETFQFQNLLKNHIKLHVRKFDHAKDSLTCFSDKGFNSSENEEIINLQKTNTYICSDSKGNNYDSNITEELPLLIEQTNCSLEVEDENHAVFNKKINNKDVFCDICNQKFNTKEELKTHKKNHKSKYICNWKNCKKVLNSAYTLKTHELKHAGKRSYLCVTCGKGFITKNSLTCHEKIHLDVKGYICKSCNIGFSVRSNLRAHEKKHHEGIRFYCSQCTKAFVSKCSLERHERIHAGVKEFQCESCPSAFYTNKELTKHQRYHQGLRLHKCNECFKTFFERHHLVIHLRTHTGERPYVCEILNCGKSFMESQKLKRHHKAKHAQT